GRVVAPVEWIAVAAGGGQVLLKGWLVDRQGRVPDGLVLDFDGCRYAASLRERTRRPDVQRHFGLQDAACGFSATVEVPPATTLADLSGARVLGEHTAAEAGAPLRLAPAVQAAIARAGRA